MKLVLPVVVIAYVAVTAGLPASDASPASVTSATLYPMPKLNENQMSNQEPDATWLDIQIETDSSETQDQLETDNMGVQSVEEQATKSITEKLGDTIRRVKAFFNEIFHRGIDGLGLAIPVDLKKQLVEPVSREIERLQQQLDSDTLPLISDLPPETVEMIRRFLQTAADDKIGDILSKVLSIELSLPVLRLVKPIGLTAASILASDIKNVIGLVTKAIITGEPIDQLLPKLEGQLFQDLQKNALEMLGQIRISLDDNLIDVVVSGISNACGLGAPGQVAIQHLLGDFIQKRILDVVDAEIDKLTSRLEESLDKPEVASTIRLLLEGAKTEALAATAA